MIIVTAKLGDITQTINGALNHIKGTISQEVGAINSFSFTIYPNNVGYDLIASRKTIIRATNDKTGRTEFLGRVLLSSEKMESSGLIYKSVTCESFLGYLCDSVQPYREEQTETLSEFLTTVINNHNARVEQEKQITLGTVDVEVAGTGNVTKGLQYQTTYETLKTKLVDVYGGEFEIVEDEGLLKLNYLRQIGTTRATRITLGRNMQAAERQINPLEIVTRVIPLGAKLKRQETDADGNITEVETEERLTLVGYTPQGGEEITVPWLDDPEKIETLGVICGTLDFSDVTEQANLYAKTINFLKKENRVNLSHAITALDLKEIGLDIDSLNCGDSYPVENEKIGLNDTLRIIKKSIDINAPYKSSLTFGDKKTTLSEMQAQNNKNTEIIFEEIKKDIQNLSNKTEITSSQVVTFGGSITDTVDAVIEERFKNVATKTELGDTEERVTYKTTETADGLKQEFTTKVKETKTNLEGQIESKFEELNAYIRYYAEDGQPYIELGQESSNLICKITNDKISFCENDIEVAYISENQLYITNATILTRLNIGKFAFIPRENGNLSFVRVK